MKKKTIAIIQARMSSRRLPGKVLMKLAGKPMLWHIVERLKKCKLVNKIVVATSTEASDDSIEDFCRDKGIIIHRGSLNNVFERFIDIIAQHNYDFFVRVTGDCPLISSSFIDKQISALSTHNSDLIWLENHSPLLVGQGVQSCISLLKLKDKIYLDQDKEHVASIHISNNPEQFKIIGLNPPPFYLNNNFRVTVDELSDYEMMNNLYQKLYKNKPIDIKDAVNWLNNNKEISDKNKFVIDSKVNKQVKENIKSWKNNIEYFCSWSNPKKLV